VLFSAISSKLPWLASGALKRTVVPAVQVPAPSANALAGNNTAPAAKITMAKRIRQD